MAAKLCQVALILFAFLYLVALLLFFIGIFGWFGQEPTPLAGVFLAPLGLPWNRWVDGLPETLWPWAASLTPLLNIALLSLACRVVRRASAS